MSIQVVQVSVNKKKYLFFSNLLILITAEIFGVGTTGSITTSLSNSSRSSSSTGTVWGSSSRTNYNRI